MTNPTLERAEQAAKREIDKLRKVRVPEYPGSWKTYEGLGWENLSEVVAATTRAVLLAVREPDDRMDNAGVNAANGVMEGWIDEGQIGFVWRDMIDAILADGGE